MASYSKVIQIGNIVHDLKAKDVNGKSCLTFSVATNFKFGDKEDSCFIDVTYWEKAADNIVKFFKKGDPILVEGELRQERWEDRDGQKRSKHVIRGTSWGFVPGARRDDSGQGGTEHSGVRDARAATAAAGTKPAPAPAAPDDDYGDDIPF